MKIAMITVPAQQLTLTPSGYAPHNTTIAVLVEALVKRGHDVTVWARKDSTTSAKLRKWEGCTREDRLRDVHRATLEALDAGFDVLHSHNALPPYFCNLIGLPMPQVRTIHHSLGAEYQHTWGALQNVFDPSGSITNVCLSAAHAKVSPVGLRYEVVPHGLDATQYTKPPLSSGEYLATFCRIFPHKGVHHAITVAERTGLPLKIAGGISYEHKDLSQAYLDTILRPRLTSKIEYVGEIQDPDEKLQFLRGAKALLNPVEWEEPFGLSVLESLFTGTPVVSFARGGPAETIEDGVTGFLVDSVDAMVAAVGRIDELPRDRVQALAQASHSPDRYAAAYEAIYERSLRTFQPLSAEVAEEHLRLYRALDPSDPMLRTTLGFAHAVKRLGAPYEVSTWRARAARLRGGVAALKDLGALMGLLSRCRPRHRALGLLRHAIAH